MSNSSVIEQHDKSTTIEELALNISQDAPPLIKTITSSKYHIKWKRLAALPAPIRGANVAVQGGRIYVAGGYSPVKVAEYQVFVYEIQNDSWGQLPTPDHYRTVPHIIDDKLTLIGGRMIATNKRCNKVSTFDQTKKTWVSYYPNLLSVRSLPGVVTHLEYVIVAGGLQGESPVPLGDIEIMNWVEGAQWKRVPVYLPIPMYALQLTVTNGYAFVVGFNDANKSYTKRVYELSISVITNLPDQLHSAPTEWVELPPTTHWHFSLVPGLFPLVVVGGYDKTVTTKDIKMYDRSEKKWKIFDLLSFARCRTAVTAINNNALIVIGGCTSPNDTESTSLDVVELGQVEQINQQELDEMKKEQSDAAIQTDPLLRTSVLSSHLISQDDKTTVGEGPQSKFLENAPPLMPTLASSKYHIKWTRLADLPVAILGASVAVQERKIYVSGGSSDVESTRNQIFVYEIDNDRWDQLPTPDHYYAIPHIIGGKLTLIGGRLIATTKLTNKVSTFNQTKQSWVSYYPNLLSVRNRPGVVTHLEYVIVAGGRGDDAILDDIEILDWIENSQWKRVSIHLPAPIYDLQLTISDNYLFVVGYTTANDNHYKCLYELPVTFLTNSADQQCTSTSWAELTPTTHHYSSLVTGLYPLTVLGGFGTTDVSADIKMYERSTQKWNKIDSLSFARSSAAVALINNNAIIVIGGYTKQGGFTDAMSSIITKVELGQVEEI